MKDRRIKWVKTKDIPFEQKISSDYHRDGRYVTVIEKPKQIFEINHNTRMVEVEGTPVMTLEYFKTINHDL